jgi:hypothetical protein
MRVSYDESHCIDASDCVSAIREHLERGWQLVLLRGAANGPFVALFRMDGR